MLKQSASQELLLQMG